MTFNKKIGKVSDFERLLCDRLQDWVTAFIQGDKPGAGVSTNSGGN